jgi:phosphoglycolate phosphatase
VRSQFRNVLRVLIVLFAAQSAWAINRNTSASASSLRIASRRMRSSTSSTLSTGRSSGYLSRGASRTLARRAATRTVRPAARTRPLSHVAHDAVLEHSSLHANEPVHAVVFDMDGTVVDSSDDVAAALKEALGDFGLQLSHEQLRAVSDGRPLGRVIDEVVRRHAPAQRAANLHARIIRAYGRHYDNRTDRRAKLYAHVALALAEIKAENPGVKLAVATSQSTAAAEHTLRDLGVLEAFDVVEGTGGTNMPPKPDPTSLQHVLAKLGVEPKNAIMVGDSPRDIEAGRAAGMRTVAAMYGYGLRMQLIKAHPTHQIGTFEDLAHLPELDHSQANPH